MSDNSPPKKKTRKTVSFSETVDIKEFNLEHGTIKESSILQEPIKKIDGISMMFYIAENLIHDYFNLKCITNTYDVALSIQNSVDKYATINSSAVIASNTEMILDVKEYIEIIQDKIKNISSWENIPVLYHGGGLGLRLQLIHATHLNKLVCLIDDFIDHFV
jgi:hypothetical protein